MVLEMPADSVAPLMLAVGRSALFVGMLLKIWVLAGIGAAIVALAVLVWLWPRTDLREREPAHG
jgi:membrane protein implicated in regulation of membrane protease activity